MIAEQITGPQIAGYSIASYNYYSSIANLHQTTLFLTLESEAVSIPLTNTVSPNNNAAAKLR